MAGPLKNQRQERFCQELAKGRTQLTAQKKAGYKPDRGCAARLAARPDIIARLAELQTRVAERAVITAHDIATQLDKDRAFARLQKQAAAAVSATMGKAKVLGLIVNQHSGPGGGPIPVQWDLTKLSNEDLETLERIRARIAAPGSDPGGTGSPAG